MQYQVNDIYLHILNPPLSTCVTTGIPLIDLGLGITWFHCPVGEGVGGGALPDLTVFSAGTLML